MKDVVQVRRGRNLTASVREGDDQLAKKSQDVEQISDKALDEKTMKKLTKQINPLNYDKRIYDKTVNYFEESTPTYPLIISDGEVLNSN